jgi:hypothetical protein
MRVGVPAGRVVMTSLATGRRITIPSRWGAHLEAGLDPVPARLWSSDDSLTLSPAPRCATASLGLEGRRLA